jgi:hypothetical protein
MAAPSAVTQQLGSDSAGEGGGAPVARLLKLCHGGCAPEALARLLQSSPESAGRVTESSGNTPLHYMCQSTQLRAECVKLLLRARPAAAGVANQWGEYPLHVLCRNTTRDEIFANGADVVRMVLEAYPGAANGTDAYGDRPLHCLVRNPAASVEAVEQVLDGSPNAAGVNNAFGEHIIQEVQARFAVLADKVRAASDKTPAGKTPGRKTHLVSRGVQAKEKLDMGHAIQNSSSTRHKLRARTMYDMK